MRLALKVLVSTMSEPASRYSLVDPFDDLGRVIDRRSLLPFRSSVVGEALAAVVASSSLYRWIMVPMAPSSSNIRSDSASNSRWTRSASCQGSAVMFFSPAG
jgi:hypothetical protein